MSKQKHRQGIGALPKGWANISEAAIYAGVSKRIISDWMKRGLKFVEVNNKTKLVKYDNIDAFLDGFHPDDPNDTRDLIDRLTKKAIGQH